MLVILKYLSVMGFNLFLKWSARNETRSGLQIKFTYQWAHSFLSSVICITQMIRGSQAPPLLFRTYLTINSSFSFFLTSFFFNVT